MIFIYTFRTFPWTRELKEIYPEVFIFGKLNDDFERFCQEVKLKQPEWIIGVAKGRKSIWESYAINQFNKGKIIKGRTEEYKLYIPDESTFPIRQVPRTTFCNWTAYKIQNFLTKENMNTKLSFIHINKNDLLEIADFIIPGHGKSFKAK